VLVVLSTTPTLASALALGATFVQVHAPSLFLCRMLSVSCMAYQLWGIIPMPMSFLFYCLAWSFPSFPPKQTGLDLQFTYKQNRYRLRCPGSADSRRKWDEVMHYLNHLPEFVDEVFSDDQMQAIKEDFFDYAKCKGDDTRKPFRITKRYQTVHSIDMRKSCLRWT
jgi:hypothetical protein